MRRSSFRLSFTECIGILLISVITFGADSLLAQSVASGTIEGTVVDPAGAVVVGATVEVQNPLTGFRQMTTTDAMGAFRFSNVPFNPYHIQVDQQGFASASQDVNVRSTVTVPVKITMSIAGIAETVNVEVGGTDIVEN